MDLDLLDRVHAGLVDPRCRLATLSAARSLVSNPDSSHSTRRSAVDAVASLLSHHQACEPTSIRAAIGLVAKAASLDRSLAETAVTAVRPFLDAGNSLAADAVAALCEAAEAAEDREGGGGSLLRSVLDEDSLLSLVSSPTLAVRSRVLDLLVRSVEQSHGPALVHTEVALQVFLVLSGDLYPSLRKGAINGLVALLKKAGGEAASSTDVERRIIECCYERAVLLLKDDEEEVRIASIKLVSECGHMFMAIKDSGVGIGEKIDGMFIQLCSMARDMCMKLRVEAFNALMKVQTVSESVLLQSLSKKFRGSTGVKDAKDVCQKIPNFPSRSAGAFRHGIEDEYYEVRAAATKSMGMLTILSTQFTDDALNLLMDMLNDDAEAVRLQTLKTLFHIAAHKHLMIQEKYIHMFLVLLTDISVSIRREMRKLLHLIKLPDYVTFRSTIQFLIKNLETYPEEEEDIFVALALMGKNHKNFSVRFAKEFGEEIVLSSAEPSLDSAEVAAKLVLSILSSFFNRRRTFDMPMVIYSYAIPFLGRISNALRGAVNQDALLAFLCNQNGIPFSATSPKSKDVDDTCSSPLLVHNTISENKCEENVLDLDVISNFHEASKDEGHCITEQLMQYINCMLRTVGGAWTLIKLKCVSETQKILRGCEEALEMIKWNANSSVSAFVEFSSQYIQVVGLIAEMLDTVELSKPYSKSMMKQDLLLERLGILLRSMRYCFEGLNAQEESHILELTLLGFVLQLSKLDIDSHLSRKLSFIVSDIEVLCEKSSSELSDFAKEVKNIVAEDRTTELFHPFAAWSLLHLFYPEQMQFVGRFRHKKAEVVAIKNDSENPFPYISGLPVGISFQITLYDVSKEDQLWLLMAMGKSIQYCFLDLSQFDGTDAVRNCIVNISFYRTPKASSFSLKVCLGLECPASEVRDWKKDMGGPCSEIAFLCEEKDVYFVNVNNR